MMDTLFFYLIRVCKSNLQSAFSCKNAKTKLLDPTDSYKETSLLQAARSSIKLIASVFTSLLPAELTHIQTCPTVFYASKKNRSK